MIDKEKIRIMAKMAVYDKRNFHRDAKANQYFRHDFIYKNNMRTRFFVGIGCLILILFYMLYLLGVENVDVFTLNYQSVGIAVLIFVVAIMVGYSFLGTILHTRDYVRSQKRVNQYFDLMSQLEKLNAKESDAPTESEDDDEDDPDFEPYKIGPMAELRYNRDSEPEDI